MGGLHLGLGHLQFSCRTIYKGKAKGGRVKRRGQERKQKQRLERAIIVAGADTSRESKGSIQSTWSLMEKMEEVDVQTCSLKESIASHPSKGCLRSDLGHHHQAELITQSSQLKRYCVECPGSLGFKQINHIFANISEIKPPENHHWSVLERWLQQRMSVPQHNLLFS